MLLFDIWYIKHFYYLSINNMIIILYDYYLNNMINLNKKVFKKLLDHFLFTYWRYFILIRNNEKYECEEFVTIKIHTIWYKHFSNNYFLMQISYSSLEAHILNSKSELLSWLRDQQPPINFVTSTLTVIRKRKARI